VLLGYQATTSGVPQCVGIYPEGQFYDFLNQTAFDNGDGTYTVQLNSIRKGQYFLFVFINDVMMTSCSTTTWLITIIPAAFDPSQTILDGSLLTSAIAGETGALLTALHDQYGNALDTGTYSIQVGVDPVSNPGLCTSLFPRVCLSLTDEIVEEVDNDPVLYQTTGFTTIAREYVLLVTVDGVWIDNVNNLRLITVNANSAYDFFISDQSIVTAAIPAEFSITATDRYGNVVQAGSHYFQAYFTLLGSDNFVNRYATSFDSVLVPQVRDSNGVSIADGHHRLVFLLQWHGSFSVAVSIKETNFAGARGTYTRNFDKTALPATCGLEFSGRPFRCPDGSCVTSYSDCGSPCSASAMCPIDNSCFATEMSCVCPAGQVKCPSGHCVSSSTQCPLFLDESDCFGNLGYRCPGTDVCRASSADCPSLRVCPPGYYACPDSLSCARDGDNCLALAAPACVSPTPYKCTSGLCVSDAANCPTAPTCPSSEPYLCSDGSCSSSINLCPSEFLCYEPTPVRCQTGACRARLEDCPSQVSCGVGQVLCASGACADILEACPAPVACSDTQVRCPDGSCNYNLLLCASPPSCPLDTPVLCPNLHCVASAEQCQGADVCSTNSSSLIDPRVYRCPNGQCAKAPEFCSPGVTCPVEFPVFCNNECVSSVTACSSLARPACGGSLPVRCSDGSCRRTTTDCPTQFTCPEGYPVRCAEARCAAASDMCASADLLACQDDFIRCPNGDCARSFAECPTVITCAPTEFRCVDGTCRDDCTSVPEDSLVHCRDGLVTCPKSSGLVCAVSLEECAQSLTCPPTKPVRCYDASCAYTLSECPPAPRYNNAKYACQQGWTSSATTCGTSTTCPSTLPVKCWDETCRLVAADCPPTPQCPETEPYLCFSGDCVADIYSCLNPKQCLEDPIENAPPKVKCAYYSNVNDCVDSVHECVDPLDSEQAVRMTYDCPNRGIRCRDGSCVFDTLACNFTCPDALPHKCFDGMCASDSADCNSNSTGCPNDLPVKCWFGACRASLEDCPSEYLDLTLPSVDPLSTCGSIGLVECPLDPELCLCLDGSCAEGSSCADESGCPSGFLRCLDKSCVDPEVGNCVGNLDDVNACPATRPFRCPDGFCAVSSTLCPVIPIRVVNENCSSTDTDGDGIVKPYRCLDGSCVLSLLQCPVVKPCAAGEVRCGDGSCRENALVCPIAVTCPSALPFRCDDGLCLSDPAFCGTKTYDGCPMSFFKCPDGLCMQFGDASTCSRLPDNGCPGESPYKCFNGACEASAANCTLTNGCSSDAPFFCNGICISDTDDCFPSQYAAWCGAGTGVTCPNGLCANSIEECLMANGCPIATPIRCANGACMANAATAMNSDPTRSCPAVVSCGGLFPYKCRDGSCASVPEFCPPVLMLAQCGEDMASCLDGSCAPTAEGCPRVCPAKQPVLCPNGACRPQLTDCDGLLDACADPQESFLCWDGSCVATPYFCVEKKHNSVKITDFTVMARTIVDGQTSCPFSSNVLCADGTCLAEGETCPAVAACPAAYPFRCWDGSCVTDYNQCLSAITCNTGTRCEDGVCRASCLPYAGCPVNTYDCVGSLERCVASATACAALLSKVVCFENCERDVPATPLSVFALGRDSVLATFSFDVLGVPRSQVELLPGTFAVPAVLQIAPASAGQLTNNAPANLEVVMASSSNYPDPTTLLKYYSEVVLSTAFTCKATCLESGENCPFQLPLLVRAAIDVDIPSITLSTSSESTAVMVAVPCELQSNHIWYVAASNPLCVGNLELTATAATTTFSPETVDSCAALSLWPTGTVASVISFQTWSSTQESRACLCFTDRTDPVTGAPASDSCSYFWRYRDIITMYTYIDAVLAATQCPSGPSSSVVTATLTRTADSADVCANAGQVIDASLVPPQEVCLGTYSATEGWRCLYDKVNRLANPTWAEWMGGQRWRVKGLLTDGCAAEMYAFLRVPVDDDIVLAAVTETWWEANLRLVFIVGGSVLGVLMLSSYVISRLIRYRIKFHAEKEQKQILQEKAAKLDRIAGGLGVADEEVVMVANPLVIELQTFGEQIRQANSRYTNQETQDLLEMQHIESDRARLIDEINRVKKLINDATKAKKLVRSNAEEPVFDRRASAISKAAPPPQGARVMTFGKTDLDRAPKAAAPKTTKSNSKYRDDSDDETADFSKDF